MAHFMSEALHNTVFDIPKTEMETIGSIVPVKNQF
jgi:hypothetical protein